MWASISPPGATTSGGTEVFWGYADGPKQLHKSGSSTSQMQASLEMEMEGWRWKWGFVKHGETLWCYHILSRAIIFRPETPGLTDGAVQGDRCLLCQCSEGQRSNAISFSFSFFWTQMGHTFWSSSSRLAEESHSLRATNSHVQGNCGYCMHQV